MGLRICLVVYDNDDFIHVFPMGLGYISGALKKAGHEIVVWNQDLHHWPDEELTRYLDENRFDVVGVGVIAGYYQYRKLLSLSRAINASKHRPFYVLGGHGPTPEPKFFFEKTSADAIVKGEGELTMVDLMDALSQKRPLSEIPGIAYLENGEVKHTAPRAQIEDLSTIAWPAYDLFPMEYYRMLRMPGASKSDFVLPVLSGRGCTFTCTFCYRMDPGFRPRSVEHTLDEVEFLMKDYGLTYVTFMDELLMISEKRTEEFCEGILRRGLKFKWNCNGRLNYATPKVLELMKRAGCVFINYGIESVDQQVLKNMRKALRVDQIYKGVQATLDAGISPGLNMIFGNYGDDVGTLKKAVDFLIEHDDQAELRTIRPVTPYPGSPLYADAIAKGMLEGPEDFYEQRHTNSDLCAVNFTELSDDEFHQALYDANFRLVENYLKKSEEQMIGNMRKLYFERDASFRGFRQR